MKKIKFLAIAMTALTFGLTSCNKESNTPNPEAEKNVTISLDNSNKQIDSRATDNSASNGTTATTFANGQLVFLKNSGEITQVYEIGATHNLAANKVGITELQGGFVTFEKITGDKVYVLGNKSIAAIIKGANLTAVLANVANVLTVADLKDGIFSNAVLAGEANIIKQTTVPNPAATSDYYAEVTISPISTRIEIEKLTEISATNDYTYKLDGIYINNVYHNMNLGGASSNKVLWTANADLNATNYPNKSATDKFGTFHDLIESAVEGKTNSPDPSVWAYNAFPAKSIIAGDDLIPHIIVRMKELKKGGVLVYPAGVDYFLTINTYGATTEFKPGYVYTIADLRFDASKNGGPIIEEALMNCDVKVSVANWIPAVLNPDVN